MKRSETCILANLCMLYDDQGNVLVEHRQKKDWEGIAFPGGHTEKGELVVDSAIREIYEETGLTAWNLELCGIKEWFLENETRYIVFLYKTKYFCGTLKSSAEGEVFWTKLSSLADMPLASGMMETLRVFCENNLSEHYVYPIDNSDEWANVLK